MAVKTDDATRYAAGAWQPQKRSLAAWRRGGAGRVARIAGRAPWLGGAGRARAYIRQARAYCLLTTGPLIRFISRTLPRRIIFANTIGLGILLGGIFYLSQY